MPYNWNNQFFENIRRELQQTLQQTLQDTPPIRINWAHAARSLRRHARAVAEMTGLGPDVTALIMDYLMDLEFAAKKERAISPIQDRTHFYLMLAFNTALEGNVTLMPKKIFVINRHSYWAWLNAQIQSIGSWYNIWSDVIFYYSHYECEEVLIRTRRLMSAIDYCTHLICVEDGINTYHIWYRSHEGDNFYMQMPITIAQISEENYCTYPLFPSLDDMGCISPPRRVVFWDVIHPQIPGQ